MSANNSGVVYVREFSEVSSSITYIDPKNPPGHRALFLRGVMQSAWSLLFSIVLVPMVCACDSALEATGLPHVPVFIAGFIGVVITYLVFLPLFLFSAKGTKATFIEFGGDPTGISLMMFCGMIPMGKSHWQSYRFISPSEREQVKKASKIKPVTGPFF